MRGVSTETLPEVSIVVLTPCGPWPQCRCAMETGQFGGRRRFEISKSRLPDGGDDLVAALGGRRRERQAGLAQEVLRLVTRGLARPRPDEDVEVAVRRVDRDGHGRLIALERGVDVEGERLEEREV